ncbi:MAG: hypothetical protein AAB772_02710 [Patescibacteria group bacterium]
MLSAQISFASYDLGVQYELRQNYLEDKNLGASAVLSNTLTVWEGNQPTISVRYLIAENSEKSAAFLPLIKKQFDFNAGLKLNEYYMLKFAATQLTEDNSTEKDFSAYGIYLNRYGKFFKKTEIALESDNSGKTLYYGYGRLDFLENADVLTGFSTENSSQNTEQRIGLAIAPHFKSYSLIFGLTHNLDAGNNAKLYGLAYSGAENSEFPSFITIFRNKPESRYFLGIVSFKGKSFNKRANQGIYDAMFSGTLSGTRVIANRNFDQIGVSNLYKIRDYGKLVITTSIGDIKISDSTSLFFDAEEMTYTFKTWFMSFGHAGETNLVFDHATRRLKEDYQQKLAFGIGAKFTKQKQVFDVNLINSYSLDQSEWSGISALLNFYF